MLAELRNVTEYVQGFATKTRYVSKGRRALCESHEAMGCPGMSDS